MTTVRPQVSHRQRILAWLLFNNSAPRSRLLASLTRCNPSTSESRLSCRTCPHTPGSLDSLHMFWSSGRSR